MDSFREGIEQLARGATADMASAILRSDEIRQAVPLRLHPLQPFDCDGPAKRPGQPSSESLDSQLQARYQDGFTDGREAALREFQHQQNALWQSLGKSFAERIENLQTAFDAELQDQQQLIAERLLDLAIELASKLVADHVVVQPSAVLPVIAECLALLPAPASGLTVRLNPADAAQLRGHDTVLSERAVAIVDDPAITPGGCRISNDELEIDATLPSRWRQLMAAIGRDTP